MSDWVVLELSPKADGEDPDLVRASIRHMVRDAEVYLPASVTKVGEDRVINYLVDGYAFVKRAHPDEKYFRLEGSRYVQCIITNVGRGPNGRPVRQLSLLKDADIDRFRGQIHAEENQGIGVGDTVVVTSGPYRQIQATVIEDVPEKEEVQVHIKLRSKEDLVTLPRSFLHLVQRALKSPYMERTEMLRTWFEAAKPFLRLDTNRLVKLVNAHSAYQRLERLFSSRGALEGFSQVSRGNLDVLPVVQTHSKLVLLDRTIRSFLFVRSMILPAPSVSPLREHSNRLGRLIGWDVAWESGVQSYEKLHKAQKHAYSAPPFDPVQRAFVAWSCCENISERLGSLKNEIDAIEHAVMKNAVEHVDVVIVDGHNLAIRCASVPGLDSLTDSKGRHTGAIIGVLRSLGSYRKRFPGAELVVTWDGSSNRRKSVFPDYKAHRVTNRLNGPISFDQIHWLRDVLPFFGVRQAWNPEEEADDVIATLVRKHSGQDCVVVSTDCDMLQLVRDEALPAGGRTRVRVFQPGKDRLVDALLVEEEYGVPPAHMVDLRAIDGDSSDNIPGVPGFGLKTAAKLLRLYGSVEGVYNSNFAGVTPAQYKRLRDAEKQVRLNLQLMVLQDVPLMVVAPDPNQIVAAQRLQEVDVKSGPIVSSMLDVD